VVPRRASEYFQGIESGLAWYFGDTVTLLKNKMLRCLFGRERQVVTVGLRTLGSAGLYTKYYGHEIGEKKSKGKVAGL
jgi:hypothetical protein